VAGRALVFSHPEVVRLLKTAFVPYAGDQWYLHRQKDPAGEFFWKVAQQGLNRNQPEDSTRQGIYAAGPDGTLLGSLNSWSSERTLSMLRTALDRWQQAPKPPVLLTASGGADAQFARQPPPGGLILDVFTRIPREPAPGEAWSPNQATGRDHMWLTRDEWRSLLPAQWRTGARYPLPQPVAHRLLRFHLVDNVRGEPPMWRPEEIRRADLWLQVEDAAAGRLSLQGTVRLESPTASRDGSARGYHARLQGFLTYDRKAARFTRCDLLAWGEAWGEGRYTGGAPEGRFPLVIALSLAGSTPADRIPPQGSRGLSDYFGRS
jgi:hypothetical protein